MIDIIICTYNNAELLKRSLASLANQQFTAPRSWSVLVVDNNCTDHTADVVDEYIYAQTIPDLRRIVETKQGLTFARMCGTNHTTSEWIAFVDDDCLLAKNWVEQAIEFATSHPQCGAFGGKVILEWETPPDPIFIKYSRFFAAIDRGEVTQRLSRANYHIPGAGLILKREALEQSGWLENQFLTDRIGKKLTSGGDSEIVLRILNAGYELWYTPNCMLHHVITASRISEAYLVNMCIGFGLAAPYIAAMRWYRSVLVWLCISILRIFKGVSQTIYSILIGSLKLKNEENNAPVMWGWTKGQIISLYNILKNEKQNLPSWFLVFK